jgi:hypothetical protein
MIEEENSECPEGMIRVYTDHTGRFYEDYTPEEYERLYNTEVHRELRKVINAEIDNDVVNKMIEIAKSFNIQTN